MKKFLVVLTIIIILGGLIFVAWKLWFKKETVTEEKLDLASFEKFDQSHFGFMHPQRSYSFAKELNVHWQRPHPGSFIWGDLEPKKGKYDWSKADKYVKESQKYEIAIMATIWPYAGWDQKSCHSKLSGSPRHDFPELGNYRQKPCDFKAYHDFVKNLVERYDGDGQDDMPGLKYPIKYWEAINEPEIQGDLLFFKGEEDPPADYLEVLKATFKAVKEADPSSLVLNGGIAALSPHERPFWQRLIDLGGAEYIDVITFHSISGPENLNLPSLKQFMSQNNLSQPFWVTEIQFGLGQGMPGPRPKPAQHLSQEEWAEYLVRTFVYALGKGAQRLFYVGLDESPGEPDSWLVNCGGKMKKLFQSTQCKKQAGFYAFKTMVEKIDYFDRVEKIAEGQYRFAVAGKDIYVLWGKAKLPAELSGKIKVTDIYGETVEMDAEQLVLDESPVFVEKFK